MTFKKVVVRYKKRKTKIIKRLKPFGKIKEKKSWQLSSRTHTFFFDYFFFVVLFNENLDYE